MTKMILTGTASALALLIAACGSNDQAGQNEAAAGDANAMMADPNNPFAQAEMQMNERMMAAVGVNAADNWVRKMIEHHRGAVEMSRIVLQQNPSPQVAEMAQQTIDKQTREIGELEKLVQQGQPDMQSAQLYQPAMAQMHNSMMAAKGENPSDTWTRKMLEHHRGGVAMVDVLLQQQGVPSAIRRQAEKTRSDQQKDIAMLERMLRGEPLEAAEAAAPAAAAPKREAARTESEAAPKPAAKPATKPAPKPTPPVDPHAGHDMNNMQ